MLTWVLYQVFGLEDRPPARAGEVAVELRKKALPVP
jgi:hypothetical protein